MRRSSSGRALSPGRTLRELSPSGVSEHKFSPRPTRHTRSGDVWQRPAVEVIPRVDAHPPFAEAGKDIPNPARIVRESAGELAAPTIAGAQVHQIERRHVSGVKGHERTENSTGIAVKGGRPAPASYPLFPEAILGTTPSGALLSI